MRAVPRFIVKALGLESRHTDADRLLNWRVSCGTSKEVQDCWFCDCEPVIAYFVSDQHMPVSSSGCGRTRKRRGYLVATTSDH